MAHQVEIIDGKAQMAYAGKVPWHGLGVPVSNDLTPTQMMEKAGLDWNVREVESFIEYDGKKMSTGLKSLVRETDGKILTNVGENWNPCQNSDAFEFFSEYVLAGDMEMHTAGSLKGGRMVWALAKIKDSFELFKGDQVDSYLLFSNPHQYGKSIDVRFTPIRVVCNNTLTLSLDQTVEKSVKVGHKSEFDPSSVKEALGIATQKMNTYKEMAVDTLSRNAKLCYDALDTQPGAQYAEGSWWQAFNAVTYVTDHVQGRNADNRLYSNWFGTNEIRKRNAINKAVEYAGV